MSEMELIRLPAQFDYGYHRIFTDNYSSLLARDDVSEIILDFSQVDYIDSSALGMMVLLQKKSSDRQVKVKIKNARGATAEILKMANMQKLFEFV